MMPCDDKKFREYLKDLEAELPSWYKEKMTRRHSSFEGAVRESIRKIQEGEVSELTSADFNTFVPDSWGDEDVLELLFGFSPDIQDDGVWAFRDPAGERWELWVDERDELALVRTSAFQSEATGEFEAVFAANCSGIDFRRARRVKNRRPADPPDTYEEFEKFRRNQ